jgi:hypothetical protein
VWPIDPKASRPPDGWTGWPDGKRFALVITHDVETKKGHDKCLDLMKIDQEMGCRSSFNFVPERYNVSHELRRHLRSNGFEVGVHDLYHDGKLYKSKKIFKERAKRINFYLKEWDCVGFRSGSMHSNLKWIHNLDIEYDSSTFDTDPFEPQPDGTGTIFPFLISNASHQDGYVELSYTLPQDFTLFILMKEKTIDIWKQKLDWIAEHGGMALMNTHPDYMNFHKVYREDEEYPIDFYHELMAYIKTKYNDLYWNVLPKDMARFWKRKFSNTMTQKSPNLTK